MPWQPAASSGERRLSPGWPPERHKKLPAGSFLTGCETMPPRRLIVEGSYAALQNGSGGAVYAAPSLSILTDTFAGNVELFTHFFQRVVGVHVDTETHTRSTFASRAVRPASTSCALPRAGSRVVAESSGSSRVVSSMKSPRCESSHRRRSAFPWR